MPRISFRTKLHIALMALTLAVTATLMLLVWADLKGIPVNVSRAILNVKLSQAAHHLSQPPFTDNIRSLLEHHDTTSPAFTRLHAELTALAATDRDPDGFGRTMHYDAYLFAPPSPDKPNLTLQLVTLNPQEAGTPYDMSPFPGMLAGFHTLTVDTLPAPDSYGHTLSGYVPIKGPDGQTLALLGIDASAADISLNRRRILFITFAGALAALLGSALFAYLLANLLNKPVASLHHGMTRLAQGDFKVSLPNPHTTDEFSSLIPQFNQMVTHLRERHEIKKSLELAAQIQLHLLPKLPPQAPHFDLHAGADYCDETGGDYFDFLTLSPPTNHATSQPATSSPDHSPLIGLVIADVAGHGIASALVMTAARSVLRSHADHFPADPGALLRAINLHLCRDVEVQKFVTLFYAILDPSTSTLLYSSAGHEEGLLLHADNSLTILPTTGMPLAILPEEPFPSGTPITLRPGDLLLVPTDGIREARNAKGEFFETSGLLDLARQHRHLPARELHAKILESVHTFRGPDTPQQDDMTLLIVKCLDSQPSR